jgi:hypothetical protein
MILMNGHLPIAIVDLYVNSFSLGFNVDGSLFFYATTDADLKKKKIEVFFKLLLVVINKTRNLPVYYHLN